MGLRMKSATGLLVILLIAFALQLVAVLSVPVTKTISLGSYQDHKFGVFGYCNVKDNTCSPAGVGYNLVDSDNAGFSLPSNARHTLSNLLIVHPIACGFTLILTVLALLAHIQGPASSSRYLLFCLVFSLPTFLLVLLSFLVDILLFVPHLDWGGWIVLAATILVAISGVVLCVMRRTLSSKKAMKKHQLDATNELSAFSSNKHLNSFTYSSKENVPQFSELRYESSHDTSKDEEVLPLTSHVYEEPGHHLADTSYASQGTNSSRVNLLSSEEPQTRESPFKDQRQDRYTPPDRYAPSPNRYDQGGPGRAPNGSRGVPPRRPSDGRGPTPPGQGPTPPGGYGRNNNPNYGGYGRPPRPRGPPGSNNSSPFQGPGPRNGAGLTPPSNLQTSTTGPMQLPAGTYLPGEEPASSPDTYGPGVIPIPEIRRESKVPGASPTPPPANGPSPAAGTPESGVSRPYRGNYTRRGSEVSAQTPPPNAQPNPPPGGAQNYEYVPARQQWNLTPEESNATAPAAAPGALQRNHSYDTYNPYRSETPSAPGSRAQSRGPEDNTLHQPVPTTVTPSNSGALNNKDSPWYSPPVDEQFRNSFIPDAPVSPSESISSNFTSVSQRGINPRYFGADGPPGGFHQGAPPPPHMRGPPPHMGGPNMGGPHNMGPRPPYGGPGPAHGNKHDLLLSGNPDFQFQPQTRRKPGRGGRPGMSPASLMGRDTGPYSMR
ncbi:pH-response regulator protein palI/RIM9 [Yarrowia sp. B02]|nr:pH-response regulator protein palI/RIM9 [Yarrowia sp. B02]